MIEWLQIWCALYLSGVPSKTLLFEAVRNENYERAEIIHEMTGEKLTIDEFQRAIGDERKAQTM